MKNKIQQIVTALALTFIVGYTANAQVISQKIGNNPTNISPNAVLEMESTTKGVLFPRVTLSSLTDLITIPSPTDGLTVFNIATAGTAPNNVSFGYYYWSSTASKWVKIAVETPQIEFAKTVYVNTASPSSATIFDETNPAANNNNALKAAVTNLYIGVNGSSWTYDPTGTGTYKTYNQPSSTPFNLGNSTTDAGNNKTGSIWRSGNLGIGMNNPTVPLEVQSTIVNAYMTAARFLAPSNTTAGNSTLLNFGVSASTGNSADLRYVYQGNAAASNRVDFGMSGKASPMISYLNNGNVGINTTVPSASLVVQGLTGTGALKLIAPSVAAGDNWWLGFGHGSTSTDANDRARIGVDIAGGGAGRLFLTTGLPNAQTRAMFIDESQRIGIGTSKPTAQFQVATTLTSAAIFRRGGASVNQSSNVYLQRTQNSDPNINTAGSYDTKIIGRLIFSMANGTSYPEYGNSSIGSYYVAPQSTSNAGGGLTFSSVNSGTITATERLRIEHNGNVGIGNYIDRVTNNYDPTNIPGSKLEVDGSLTNKTAYNAGSSTTIDFSKSNLAYTSNSPNAFILQNIKDGGTYTLAVQGTVSGSATFNASGFTFKSSNNGQTVAGKETIYTFIVMGTSVYVNMTTGIN
jgi:hypothetical protein